MLEIFRQNHFLNSLLLLPYAAVLGIDTLIYPTAINFENTSLLFQWAFSGLSEFPLTASLLAVFLLFIQAAMINRLIIKHRLSRISSLLPGVVYIVLMNALPEVRGFHDVLVANTFVIALFGDMLQIIRKFKIEKLMYNLGLWSALSTLFYPGYVVMIILIILSIFILRSFSIKEIGQSLAGFLTILVLSSCIFYLKGDWGYFISGIFQFNINNVIHAFDISTIPNIMKLVVVYFLLLFCFFNYSKFLMKQTIKEQKKIGIFYWALLLVCFSIFFNRVPTEYGILTLAFPIAVLTGMFLANWKQKVVAEIIHLCVIIGILFIHLQIII